MTSKDKMAVTGLEKTAIVGVLVGVTLICAALGVTSKWPTTTEPSTKSLPGVSVDGLELVYFRDDVHQLCYAYFKQHPDSLVEVDCEKGHW